MMMSLTWIIPGIFFAIVIAGYAMNREFLAETTAQIEYRRRQRRISERPRLEGDGLQTADLHKGVKDLVEHARELAPEWIIGLHPGGRLLSTYVAEQLGVPHERCRFASTDDSRSDVVRLEPPLGNDEQMTGQILVIDDISRGGNTFRLIRAFFEHFAHMSGADSAKLDIAALVVCLCPDRLTNEDAQPNWAAFRTANKDFKLPWSPLSAAIKVAFGLLNTKHELTPANQPYIDIHHRLIYDFDYAASEFRKYWSGKSYRTGVSQAA